MYKKLSSFTLKGNQEINKADLNFLLGTQLLDTVNMYNVKFTGLITLNDFQLSLNSELISINLDGSEGISIISKDKSSSVPLNWSKLTKLQKVNFKYCGLIEEELTKLILDFNSVVNNGLGSSILKGKTLTLDGQNAKLLLSNADVKTAKDNLISKGWEVLHN